MEKRNKNYVPSIVEDDYTVSSNEALDIVTKPVYNEPEQTRVRSRFSAHLKYTGQVTGKLYEWLKSGDVVEVDARDVADLLTKKIGEKSCCGNTSRGNILFELA